MLSLTAIKQVIDSTPGQISEIVLSGGEPTLHPQLCEIVQCCKASGAFVSLNTHAGHPLKLARALPWIDELKIHVDSFDPQLQRQSMGISIHQVRKSIDEARRQPCLKTILNHPIQTIAEACSFIAEARLLEVDCKLIEMLDEKQSFPRLNEMPLTELGYRETEAGAWLSKNGRHLVMTRRCTMTEQFTGVELFVDADGVRKELTAPISAEKRISPPSRRSSSTLERVTAMHNHALQYQPA